MNRHDRDAQVIFEAPSPGSWELETTHMSRPATRWLAHVLPPAHVRGFRAAMAAYGLLMDTFEVAAVNGFFYGCPRIVGAPKAAKGPPPKLVFKLLMLAHPEIRRRNRRVEQVFATKAWRDDVRRWDEELAPKIRAANVALQSVRPGDLDDDALLAHVRACTDQLSFAIETHHSLNACTGLPVGDLVARTRDWTSLPTPEILAVLRGSTPLSAGATKELERLARALESDPSLEDCLSPEVPATVAVDTLRDAPGEVGRAMTAWLDLVGHRILSGTDLSERYGLELPQVLRGAVAAARAGRTTRAGSAGGLEEATARVRDAVPDRHRAEFDEMLAEARFVNRVRDERTNNNDLWTLGLLRRALLEAGRRLAERGAIGGVEHVVDLVPDELGPLLRGAKSPSRDEIAERVSWRTTKTTADAPARLGAPPSPPPPADWLPPAQARAMRAIDALMAEMFHVPEKNATDPASSIRGLAASPGRYEGRARVVLGADAFGRVEHGDVLVARVTCPTYNVLLPIIGGVVTDRGGLLSHAAVVAREYGLPAVVGTSDATRRIRDGARVRVDGTAGTVEVVA